MKLSGDIFGDILILCHRTLIQKTDHAMLIIPRNQVPKIKVIIISTDIQFASGLFLFSSFIN